MKNPLKILIFDEHYGDVGIWKSWYDANCDSPKGYADIIDDIVQMVSFAHPKISGIEDIGNWDVEIGFVDSLTSMKTIAKMYSETDVLFVRENFRSGIPMFLKDSNEMITIFKFEDHIEVNLPTQYLA